MTNERNYGPETVNLMREIESCRIRYYNKHMTYNECIELNRHCEALCRRERKLAEDSKDSFLLAHSLCFLEECFFAAGNISELLSVHFDAVNLLKKEKIYDRLISTLEHFALITSLQGNVSLALENEIESAEFCRRYGLTGDLAHIYENLGDMYKNLRGFDEAVNTYDLALRTLDRSSEVLSESAGTNVSDSSLRARILSSKAFCLLNMENNAGAAEALSEAEKYSDASEFGNADSAIKLVRLMYLHNIGSTEYEKAITDFLEYTEKYRIAYHIYPYLTEFCAMLMTQNKYDIMLTFINKLEHTLPRELTPSVLLPILPFKIMYYQKYDNKEEYYKALYTYYQFRRIRDDTLSKLTCSALDYRVKLDRITRKSEKIEKSIEDLTIRTEKDTFTGIYNYSKLQEVLEAKLEYCSSNKKKLGLSIIDVDFFKQFNDRYGHEKGDEALKAVASAMLALTNDHIFCGRYGGDEFIMLFVDMEDPDILNVCEKLRTNVRNCGIEHYATHSGKLSVSQGVRNSIPIALNRSWDYLYAADQSLYDVKNYCKGNIQMVSAYFNLRSDKLIEEAESD